MTPVMIARAEPAGRLSVSVTPNQIAGDETAIRINDQQYWLYAAANPETNEPLHVRLFTTTTALTEMFLRELREKHDVDDALFLVDDAAHVKSALRRTGLRFQAIATGIGTLSNVFFAIENDEPPRFRTASAMSN